MLGWVCCGRCLVHVALLRHEDVREGAFVGDVNITWLHIAVVGSLFRPTTAVVGLSDETPRARCVRTEIQLNIVVLSLQMATAQL